MIFRKYRRLLLTVFLIGCLVDGKSVSQAKMSNRIDIEKNSGTTLALPQPTAQAEVSDFLADYRKLRAKKSEAAMRILATVGLVSGVLKVQEAMKINLDNIANEMFNRFNVSTPKENMEKLLLIEETMERDKSSIGVLNSILGFARNAKSFDEIQKDMQTILKENEMAMAKLRYKKSTIANDANATNQRKNIQTGKLVQRSEKSMKYEMVEKLNDVKEMIDRHMSEIHSSVTTNAERTVKFIQLLQKSNANLTAPNRNDKKKAIQLNPALSGLLQIWNQLKPENPSPDVSVSFEFGDSSEKRSTTQKSFLPHSTELKEQLTVKVEPKLDRFRRQDIRLKTDARKQNQENELDVDIELNDEADAKNDDTENEIDNDDTDTKTIEAAKGEAGDGEFDEESGSSSASEEQGGLAGLIANLSGGDEGSDVGAIIGALTQVVTNLFGPGGLDIPSLIGTAAALLSSLLGGDENFGKVLGNYAGLAVDGLSGGGGAINNGQFFGQFVGKLISSLSADPDDEDLPPKPGVFIENVFDGIGKGAAKKVDGDAPAGGGGSDSGSFITHVITTIVAGIVSGIANASLGSSGGSSHGSAGLSGGSSHGSSSTSGTKA